MKRRRSPEVIDVSGGEDHHPAEKKQKTDDGALYSRLRDCQLMVQRIEREQQSLNQSHARRQDEMDGASRAKLDELKIARERKMAELKQIDDEVQRRDMEGKAAKALQATFDVKEVADGAEKLKQALADYKKAFQLLPQLPIGTRCLVRTRRHDTGCGPLRFCRPMSVAIRNVPRCWMSWPTCRILCNTNV